MASSSAARKLIPKKLEEELYNIPKYKPQNKASARGSVSKVLDDSIERAMFDQILGPLVNPSAGNAYRRPTSTSSPIRPGQMSSTRTVNYGENIINMSTSGLLKAPSPFRERQPSGDSNYEEDRENDKSRYTQGVISPRGERNNSTKKESSQKSSSSSFNDSILTRLSSVEADNKELRRQMAEKVNQMERLEVENKNLRRIVMEDAPDTHALLTSADGNENDNDNDEIDSEEEDPDYMRSKNRLEQMHHPATKVSTLYVGGGDRNRRLLEECEELRADNADLEAQVVDMEQFLRDYGLEWVGKDEKGPAGERESSAKEAGDANSKYKVDSKPKDQRKDQGVDFYIFEKKVKELNNVINSEPAQIRRDKFNQQHARVMQPSEFMASIPLTFYENGLMIQRGPFRAVGSDGYRSFVKDVMDGYFPSDFRKDHPDGVLFDLKDRHNDKYSEDTTYSKNSNIVSFADKDRNDTAASLSKSQILNNLPKTRISATGEVISIRGDVENMLSGETDTSGRTDGATSTGRVLSRLVQEHADSKGGRDRDSAIEFESSMDASASDWDRESKDSDRNRDAGNNNDKNDKDAPPSYQLSGLLSSPSFSGFSGGGKTKTSIMGAGAHADSKEVLSSDDGAQAHKQSKQDSSAQLPQNRAETGSQVVIINTPASEAGLPRNSPRSPNNSNKGSSKFGFEAKDVANRSSPIKASEATAMVRIKWLDGTMLHMKMWESEMIGDVREHIRRHLYNSQSEGQSQGEGPDVGFELRSAHPPRALADSKTIQEAGLVPNGTLHARKL